MHQHPFASQRFLQAAANLEALVPVMKAGDLEAFIKIVELEALSLHAMMMTSNPYFILASLNNTCLRALGSYFLSSNFSGFVRGFFLVT